MARIFNVNSFADPAVLQRKVRSASVGVQATEFIKLLEFKLPNSPVHSHSFIVKRNQASHEIVMDHLRFNNTTRQGPGITLQQTEIDMLLHHLADKELEKFEAGVVISSQPGRELKLTLKVNAWNFLRVTTISEGSERWVELPSFRLDDYLRALGFVKRYITAVNAEFSSEQLKTDLLPQVVAFFVIKEMAADPCDGCVRDLANQLGHKCLGMTTVGDGKLTFTPFYIEKAKIVADNFKQVQDCFNKLAILLGKDVNLSLERADLLSILFADYNVYTYVLGQCGAHVFPNIPKELVREMLSHFC